ncbi:hypothetical protein BLNAU_1592 [Blattamonas nauphoetae]|uniref:Right handed beta helix domain-containing protein n=1 Tax=Blattamonas nauphoetae TaxID=2049346 RepID=A0ABQ9YIG3_9EUKA|nr:hypothetical protein BLNAU_1592 [Blattamonas nauphoetae]
MSLLVIILSCFDLTFAADQLLEPFQNLTVTTSKTISLPDGTFVGASITLKPRQDRTIKPSQSSGSVILKSNERFKNLLIVNTAELRLEDVGIQMPDSAHFIKAKSTSLVVFTRVLHHYTQRYVGIVDLDNSDFEMIQNKINPHTTGNSMIISSSNSTKGEVKVTDCTFARISMEERVPVLIGLFVPDVIISHCSFSAIINKVPFAGASTPIRHRSVSISDTTMDYVDGALCGNLLYALMNGTLTLDRVTISNSKPTIYMSQDVPYGVSTVEMSSCTLNSKLDLSRSSAVTINSCMFSNPVHEFMGGALAFGERLTNLEITNSSFLKNDASGGGAMMFAEMKSKPTFLIKNCTFSNQAGTGSDIYFEKLPSSVTQKSFVSCKSRSKMPSVYDMAKRKGYNWTNS